MREIRPRISFLLPAFVATCAFMVDWGSFVFLVMGAAEASVSQRKSVGRQRPLLVNFFTGVTPVRRVKDPRPASWCGADEFSQVFCGIEDTCAGLAGGLPGGVNRDVVIRVDGESVHGGGLFSSRVRPYGHHQCPAGRQVNSSAFSKLRVEMPLLLRRPCERGM